MNPRGVGLTTRQRQAEACRSAELIAEVDEAKRSNPSDCAQEPKFARSFAASLTKVF